MFERMHLVLAPTLREVQNPLVLLLLKGSPMTELSENPDTIRPVHTRDQKVDQQTVRQVQGSSPSLKYG